jgi:hypothetical protein
MLIKGTDPGTVLRWLSKHKVEEDYERLYMKRHKETGSWLLKSKEYRQWHKAPKTAYFGVTELVTPLYFHLYKFTDKTLAGVGKSVLAQVKNIYSPS